LPNTSLVSNIVFANSGTTVMTTTKAYDNLNRLTSIQSAIAGSSTNFSYAYSYNSANQRTRVNLADGSYWLYQYDPLGQVVSANRYWSDGSPVLGQQFGYGFDTIGNRGTASLEGNTGSYTANLLNQYTQRTVPGFTWESE
jgi:YD repeat-containing protein